MSLQKTSKLIICGSKRLCIAATGKHDLEGKLLEKSDEVVVGSVRTPSSRNSALATLEIAFKFEGNKLC